jgi:hypothetical protein
MVVEGRSSATILFNCIEKVKNAVIKIVVHLKILLTPPVI